MLEKRTIIPRVLASISFTFLVAGAAFADISVDEAAELDAEAAATLAEFKANTDGVDAILSSAKGILVCPEITKAGLGFGAEGGQCVLTDGASEKLYYGTFGVKGGFIAGIQQHSMILALNSDDALDKFTKGDREWELGVDASVAVAEIGAGGDLDTSNLKADVVSFMFGQKGLMADISWKGSRFKKLDVE